MPLDDREGRGAPPWDCDAAYPIEIRLAIASAEWSKLISIWTSKSLHLKTKLKIFECGVCSKATHGFEAWQLTPSNVVKLKQWCARRLAVITGNLIATEYKFPSYDLVAALRVHRLRWLGHVLRMDSSRDVRKAVLSIQQPYPEGSLFMDAPRASTDELIEMAKEREDWNIRVNALKWRLEIDSKPNEGLPQ